MRFRCCIARRPCRDPSPRGEIHRHAYRLLRVLKTCALRLARLPCDHVEEASNVRSCLIVYMHACFSLLRVGCLPIYLYLQGSALLRNVTGRKQCDSHSESLTDRLAISKPTGWNPARYIPPALFLNPVNFFRETQPEKRVTSALEHDIFKYSLNIT